VVLDVEDGEVAVVGGAAVVVVVSATVVVVLAIDVLVVVAWLVLVVVAVSPSPAQAARTAIRTAPEKIRRRKLVPFSSG
jgi:hypothetical protein